MSRDGPKRLAAVRVMKKKRTGSKLNSMFLLFCFVFVGLGGPEGGFGGFPVGSKSSGKATTATTKKKATKTTTRTTKTNKNKKTKQNNKKTLFSLDPACLSVCLFFGHKSESSGAFWTKIGGNLSFQPPGPF